MISSLDGKKKLGSWNAIQATKTIQVKVCVKWGC